MRAGITRSRDLPAINRNDFRPSVLRDLNSHVSRSIVDYDNFILFATANPSVGGSILGGVVDCADCRGKL